MDDKELELLKAEHNAMAAHHVHARTCLECTTFNRAGCGEGIRLHEEWRKAYMKAEMYIHSKFIR
jgi:hypothetical protein